MKVMILAGGLGAGLGKDCAFPHTHGKATADVEMGSPDQPLNRFGEHR